MYVCIVCVTEAHPNTVYMYVAKDDAMRWSARKY